MSQISRNKIDVMNMNIQTCYTTHINKKHAHTHMKLESKHGQGDACP